MRVGQNPAKFVEGVPHPKRVTVVIVTYIPFLGGYYDQSLVVLQKCMESLWKHTQIPYDLLVFDNASCDEVRDYLANKQKAGKIQYLVFSEKNVGKAAAWNLTFKAAPGEIIAYADSDIYFYPGWLQAMVETLETVPNAGMVTGIPMWSPVKFSTATVEWAEFSPEVMLDRGKLLSWEDYWKHAQSLGQDEPTARNNFSQQIDTQVTYQGQKFFVGAGHFQFAAWKKILDTVLPIPADRPMGQVRRLDVAVNEKNCLRLSTQDWWVRHMGNTLSEEFMGKTAASTPEPSIDGSSVKGRLQKVGAVRRVVQWIYHKAFNFLYRE